jgi:hypothetical protein
MPGDSSKAFWGFISVLCLTKDIMTTVKIDDLYDKFGFTFKVVNNDKTTTIYTSRNIKDDYVITNPVEIIIAYEDASIKWSL